MSAWNRGNRKRRWCALFGHRWTANPFRDGWGMRRCERCGRHEAGAA